jgi:sugar-specific transcriptional regulator TrmB
MINYIRHDEEFYFIAKLVSGESIIGKGFAIEQDSKTQIYCSDPIEVLVISRPTTEGKTVKGVTMNKWMEFSDEEFFILDEKDIITIAGLSQEMVYMYELFIKKSSSKETVEDEIEDKKVEVDSDMGLKGKVNELRSKLEQIYKQS